MRIMLAPVGSRGDVQPFVALGQHLQARGHEVVVCASENYEDFVEGAGLRYAFGGRDVQKVIAEMGQGVFNPMAFIKVGTELARETFRAQLCAARGLKAEVIVGGVLAFGAATIAELLGCKFFWAGLFPGSYRTREYAFPLFGVHFRWGWLNRLTWVVGIRLLDLMSRRVTNGLRAEHGLPPITTMEDFIKRVGPVLYAVDPLVAAPPADWTVTSHSTGYWFLDDPTPLPPEVEAFLSAGEPPVYVGFGSMPLRDAAARTRAVIEAIEASGRRALISAGWGNLGEAELPASCLRIGPVSHAKLFPRVAAIVHHAGAGTTAAAIRAGVPQIPVPHGFDQAAWAHKVLELGIGSGPVSSSFSGEELSRALAACLADDEVRARAATLGEKVRATEGVRAAARILEHAVDGRSATADVG